VKISVVRIGNSQGIRIPRAVLKACQITGSVDLKVEGRRLILTPAGGGARRGWREAAERMTASGDDELLIPDVLEDDVAVEW
jgi:antitoxin MazE